MGSGSLQAMTIFESKYKDNMTRDEAVALVTEAISAGIYHDLGSGSHVDYCVITKDKSEMFRNAVKNENLHPISI
jgi:20S proteasome subunit beta 2